MGRPSKPLLNRDRIARIALDLLDREGIAGLTMRNLARSLNVKSPSLYHHVAGQAEIIDLIHELLDAEIDTTLLLDPDWRDGFQSFARSYRAAFLRHPNAVALVTRRSILVPNVLRLYDDLAGALLRAGVAAHRVMPVIAILDYIVLGSTVDDFEKGFAIDASSYVATFPRLAVALAETVRASVNDDAFETALELLLSRIEQEITLVSRDGPSRSGGR